MLETVGKKLAKARETRRLSIEDVEHSTCIPHDRIRELEDDDYSQFANLTYAKSFLKLYSDYLEVDTSEYRDELSLYEVDDFGSDPLANEYAGSDEPKRRPALFTGMVLLVLASLAGAYIFSEYSGKGEGKESEGDPPKIVGVEGEGEDDFGGPSAKPPGGVPEVVVPPVAKPVTPAEVRPEPPAVANVAPTIPGDVETMRIGEDELPVLPAVIVEDDELLPEKPVEEGDAATNGSGEGQAAEGDSSPAEESAERDKQDGGSASADDSDHGSGSAPEGGDAAGGDAEGGDTTGVDDSETQTSEEDVSEED